MDKPVIIIIDDDPDLRKTLSDILKIKGYEAVAAKCGAEGLDLLKKGPVNLVLIDLQLPDVPGLEVLKVVKADYPGTEAIILTGNATLDSAIEATNKGAYSYLVKPYEIDQVLVHIRRAIEKQQAEQSIRNSEKALQKILNALPYGVYIIGLDRRVRQVNKAAMEISGYESAEQMTGSLCQDTMCPEEEGRCPILDLGQHLHQSERLILSKDGRKVPALKSVVTIELNNEEVLLEAVVNLTERKKMEQDLQLAQATLFHASRLSQLGEMAAGIAHEINQPLNVIGMTSQAIIIDAEEGYAPPLHPRLSEKLKIIGKQVVRIKGIIDHLRTFARKEQGHDKYSTAHIEDLLKAALSMLSEQFRLKGIRIEKDIMAGLPRVKVNVTQIEQVFLNIMTNAKDAMEDRPGDTEKLLLIRAFTNSDGDIAIKFTDNGKGVPEEIADRIFDPFFTTKEVGKGTGLGLSISYGIIKKHGGKIDIEDNEGHGSTFRIVLPPYDKKEVSNG